LCAVTVEGAGLGLVADAFAVHTHFVLCTIDAALTFRFFDDAVTVFADFVRAAVPVAFAVINRGRPVVVIVVPAAADTVDGNTLAVALRAHALEPVRAVAVSVARFSAVTAGVVSEDYAQIILSAAVSVRGTRVAQITGVRVVALSLITVPVAAAVLTASTVVVRGTLIVIVTVVIGDVVDAVLVVGVVAVLPATPVVAIEIADAILIDRVLGAIAGAVFVVEMIPGVAAA
jgi:hypothetical protein